MKNNDRMKWFFNSISFKLLFLIFLFVVPPILLLIYNNNLSRETLLMQIEDTHRNMLQSYIVQIDNHLNTARSYAINLSSFENDPHVIAKSQEEAPIQYAKTRILRDMSDKLLTNNLIDGYFLYVEETDGSIDFITRSNNTRHSFGYETLKKYVASCTMDGTSIDSKWHLRSIEGNEFLFFLTAGYDEIYSGAYVQLSTLLNSFEPSNVSGSQLGILPIEDLAAFTNSLPTDMHLVFFISETSDFMLTEIFYHDDILDSLPFMQKYTLLVSILLILLVTMLIILLHYTVTKPLLTLTAAMYRIQQGNINDRVPITHVSTEIAIVNNTFNNMMEDINSLKIDIYEEQIKTQKAQLRNLQMQIKPHFLINSLNTVFNLIGTQQYPIALKLIQYSIDYFRFMVQVDENLVLLQDELDHVKAYLGIQSIRYHNCFSYAIHVDPMISDMLIPPVMIQNCVENSIKYALSMEEILNITITVSYHEKDYFPYGKITISDTGNGYPEEQLKKLNAGDVIQKSDGLHIGIRNTIQRLKILFGEKASWEFRNDEGAIAEFIIPATFSETEEESP